MASQQPLKPITSRLEALEIFSAFLGITLGGIFMLIVRQNATNLRPESPWENRFLTLLVAMVALCCLLGSLAVLLRARRVSSSAHVVVALGLIGVGLFTSYSLLTSWGSFTTVPWSGIMVIMGLFGLGGLFGWFAWRAFIVKGNTVK